MKNFRSNYQNNVKNFYCITYLQSELPDTSICSTQLNTRNHAQNNLIPSNSVPHDVGCFSSSLSPFCNSQQYVLSACNIDSECDNSLSNVLLRYTDNSFCVTRRRVGLLMTPTVLITSLSICISTLFRCYFC